MDEKTFSQASKLARIDGNSTIYEASRMVMVDGISQGKAAKDCSISQPAVSVAVKRIKKITAQALDLAEHMNSKGDK